MIQADKRRRFGKPITLNDGVAKAGPEGLRFSRQRGAAGHHGKKSPAEPAANFAEAPPSQKEMGLGGAVEGSSKIFLFSTGLEVALDLPAQGLDKAKHGNQSHNVLPANVTNNFCGTQGVHEIDYCAEDYRQNNDKKWPEDLAQRKQLQHANWIEETFIAAVMFQFRCNRRNVGENISVRKH